MGKRKNPQNFNASKDDSITWTPHMDDALIDAYVYQNNVGNRVRGTFTSKAHDLILQELSEKFPDVHFDKEKIKNCMKFVKRGFGPYYDIFKNGLSGFAWNSATSTWCAEPEVWQKLLEVKIKLQKIIKIIFKFIFLHEININMCSTSPSKPFTGK
jgi:Myb/SANT-like DNA-binding domain